MSIGRAYSLVAMMLAFLSVTDSAAESAAPTDRCSEKQTTIDIVECVAVLTQEEDRRLNTNYQKALKAIDPAGIPAFRASERAWLEFRKQRCAYLSAGDGTIMRIVAANCMLEMTKDRADELQGDSLGLAGPG